MPAFSSAFIMALTRQLYIVPRVNALVESARFIRAVRSVWDGAATSQENAQLAPRGRQQRTMIDEAINRY